MNYYRQDRFTIATNVVRRGLLGVMCALVLMAGGFDAALASTGVVDSQEKAVTEEKVEESPRGEQPSPPTAESPESIPQEEHLELFGRAFATTLQHEEVSRAIDNFSRRIDSFFGHDRLYYEITETYASFKLSGLYGRGGELSTDAKFRLRLDLPRTESRIKLRLESDDDKYYDETSPTVPTAIESLEDKDVNASLQLILQETRNWSVSLSPGVKLSTPVDFYIKLRLRRSFDLLSWRLRFVQAFEWYESTGYGSKSTLYFDRIISERSLLRLVSEAYHNQEDYSANEFRVSQRARFFYTLDEKVSLSTELATIGHTQPNWHHEHHYFNIRARRDIHQGFVFLELKPQIDFQRDHGFHGEPSVMLTLEILFGANY